MQEERILFLTINILKKILYEKTVVRFFLFLERQKMRPKGSYNDMFDVLFRI